MLWNNSCLWPCCCKSSLLIGCQLCLACCKLEGSCALLQHYPPAVQARCMHKSLLGWRIWPCAGRLYRSKLCPYQARQLLLM